MMALRQPVAVGAGFGYKVILGGVWVCRLN